MRSFAFSLAVTVALVAGHAGAVRARSTDPSPVHVHNHATPSEGRFVLDTRELWRAGAGEDGPLFGVIVQALTDEQLNVYLLDKQQSTVWKFAADGLFLGSLAREGEGPGEIRRPADMAFLPDGTVGICSQHSGRLVCVNLQGIPQRSVQVGGPGASAGETVWLEGVASRAGSLVFLCQEILHSDGKQTTNHFLTRVDEDGRESHRYFEKSVVDDFADFRINEVEQFYPKGRLWAIGPDGRVYLVPFRNRYRIDVYAKEGGLQTVIELDYPPVRRDGNEREATRKAYEEWYKSLSARIELEDTEPAITRLMVDDNGQLWVLSSRGIHGQPTGIMATYDIFDDDGRFVRQIAVRCYGDGRYDDLFFLGSERALLITGAYEAAMASRGIPLVRDASAEPKPMEVICLQMGGRPGPPDRPR
jgi:hypothetical protein